MDHNDQDTNRLNMPTLLSSEAPRDLRIACLLPSATSICVALGLGGSIVGVTHECEMQATSRQPSDDLLVLTKNGLTVDSQGEIHEAISGAANSNASSSCSVAKNANTIPSFYPLLQDKFNLAKPNVVFTQDLCAVCAPTSSDVEKLIVQRDDNDDEVLVISLQPTTLSMVGDSFVTVAKACGIEERGVAFRNQWWNDLQRLQSTILKHRNVESASPKMFLLEWLDPPFDSGHWTYQMMDFACVEMAIPKKDVKSKVIEWNQVYDAKPDVLVVGCCGFDLERNVKDTLKHADKFGPLVDLATSVFACDGNLYIAQPGPALLQGVAILAQCAYHDQPQVLKAIEALGILPASQGFQLVDVSEAAGVQNDKPAVSEGSALGVGDIEDIVASNGGFAKLHEDSCQEGKLTYDDPETGYMVFTELAHKKRGFCCGSGCRHCPFSHENVGDKSKKIQQPAIMYQQSSNADMFSLTENASVKVLFHSGGKDSFLTIRAMARSHRKDGPFGLVLLTTFDSTSRNIAHQDIPIDDVVRQAKHLDITLLGVPLRRGSGERYTSRIKKGLDVIQSSLPTPDSKITSLVFGDLHLEHIKSWRDNSFQNFDLHLEYPLWKADYEALLTDLENSQVPCYISGSTVVSVQVGSLFNRQFYERAIESNCDGFGECGEFHSLAKVWEAERQIALG